VPRPNAEMRANVVILSIGRLHGLSMVVGRRDARGSIVGAARIGTQLLIGPMLMWSHY